MTAKQDRRSAIKSIVAGTAAVTAAGVLSSACAGAVSVTGLLTVHRKVSLALLVPSVALTVTL